MEVEGITIVIAEVDKYISAIQTADSAQALVKQLIDYLSKCQRKLARGKEEARESILSNELSYCTHKIVRTIAREGPNPQLILALTEIVTYFSALSVTWLLEVISTLSQQMTVSQDPIAAQTAMVLVLVATCKSGKIADLVKNKDKSSYKQITMIAKHFVVIAGSKVLEDIAFEGLIQLLSQLQEDSQIFRDRVLPSISPLFDAKRWSLHVLVLALQIGEHFKDVDLSKAANHLKQKLIASPTHLHIFSNIFAHYIPELDHQFWTLTSKSLQQLATDSKVEFVSGIWKTIAGILASKKKDSKLLTFFNWLWELDSAVRPSLLIAPFFTVLRRQHHAQQKDEEVPPVLEKMKEITLQSKAIGGTVLRGYPELATSLPQNVVSDIVTQFVAQFYEQPQNALHVAQALSQIARDTTNTTFMLDITKFLFFHSFYISKPKLTTSKKAKVTLLPTVLGVPLRVGYEGIEKSEENGKEEKNGKSKKKKKKRPTRTLVQQLFFKVLVHHSSVLTGFKSAATKKKDQEDAQKDVSALYFAIIQFHQQLGSFSEQIELRKKLPKEALDALHGAATVVHSIKALLTTNPTDSESINKHNSLDAFLLLLCIIYLFQIADPDESPDSLTDLIQCYQEIFASSAPASKKTPIKKQKEGPNTNKNKAIAVLVDVIISLQAKPHYLVATLPEYIIRSFTKELTAESIELILQAITEYSLNKIEGGDENSEQEEGDGLLFANEDQASGDDKESNEKGEEENSEEDANDSGSDIMIDDLDDDMMKDLDGVIKEIMKKERKPKIKPPTGSTKDPYIEFRERCASLLFSYVKKAQTAALLELIPALLEAIHKLQSQQQQKRDADRAKGGEGEGEGKDAKKHQYVNQFYKSVIVRLSEIIKEICHTRSALAQQLTPDQKNKIFAALIPFCDSEQGVEISKLAVDALFLVNRSTDQIFKLLSDSSSKNRKQVSKYILHTLCSRHPTLVWGDTLLFSLITERYPQQMDQLVSSLDIENLKNAGRELEKLLNKQVKEGSKISILPTLRAVVQRMVSLSNREKVKEEFPELVFTLNKLQENTNLPDLLRKLARQITTIGFVGSQKQFKKQNKAKAKEQKENKKEEGKEEGNKEEESGEEEETGEGKLKKGELYFTKSKAYQKSRKRKTVSDKRGEEDEGSKPKHGRRKEAKDKQWFANSDAKRRKM
eukprot:Phypoly_transcript_01128.p1 GENE.Phypoly_transcript_01128~~Phypoly_transcript_01128.p1  ORF type:complete len:1208 (+),score=272.38 Phypoly_transcript_01128:81-3626(+)